MIDKEKKPTNIDLIKSSQLVNSLKACTQFTINIYKQISLSPKISDTISDVNSYCKNLQKMLRKLLQLLPKFTVSLVTHTKMKNDYQNLQQELKKIKREEKNFVCEINVLQNRLQQAERKQERLLQQRKRDKRFTADFQTKIQKIKRDSEESIKKVIEVSKEKSEKLGNRKQSLPTINSYANRQKLSLMWLMDSPKKGPKTSRLIQHLIQKY